MIFYDILAVSGNRRVFFINTPSLRQQPHSSWSLIKLLANCFYASAGDLLARVKAKRFQFSDSGLVDKFFNLNFKVSAPAPTGSYGKRPLSPTSPTGAPGATRGSVASRGATHRSAASRRAARGSEASRRATSGSAASHGVTRGSAASRRSTRGSAASLGATLRSMALCGATCGSAASRGAPHGSGFTRGTTW
jgi:hypothetical protein